MIRLFPQFLALLVLVSTVACLGDGGSGGATPPGAGGAAGGGGSGLGGRPGGGGIGGNRPAPDAAVQASPEFNTACSAYANSFCRKLMECEPATVTVDFNDMATCITRKSAQCQLAVVAPGAMLTPPTLMACAGQLGVNTCENIRYKQVPACNFRGRKLDGAACADSWQCGSGICTRTRGVNCGTCARELGMNAQCGENDCGATLECSDNLLCQIPSDVGGACSAAQPCKAGTYCAGNQCAAQVEVANGACPVNAACAGHKGFACVQQQCQPIQYARTGQACGMGNSILCQGSSECSIAQGNTGTCSGVALDNQACGGAAGSSCLAPAECMGGFCKIPVGAECN
jgi:hypothetical protein